jgi:hypothetical protein
LKRLRRQSARLHDRLDRLLHIGPFCISGDGCLAHIVDVEVAIARAERDLFAVLAIPGQLVDGLSGTHGDCGGRCLGTKPANQSGNLPYLTTGFTHLDVVIEIPQVKLASPVHRTKHGRMFRMPLGIKHIVAGLFERIEWCDG